MQTRYKIKAAIVISILLHLLLIGTIKDYPDDYIKSARKIIDIEYYKEEPVREVVKKEPLKPKPHPKQVKKRVKRVKKPVAAKKKEPPKIKPEEKFTLEEEKVRVKSEESLPDKKVAKKAVSEKEKAHTPEPSPLPKVVHKEKPEKPKGAEFSLLKELLERERREAGEKEAASRKKLREARPAEKKDVKVAKILPSIDRLEELERIEREHTRGLDDSTMETVMLDSMDVKYVSYLDHIKVAIELAWNYPEAAARRGIEGEGVMTFTVDKEGKLKEIKLLNTTGSKVLDDRFLRAVKMAAPFPPLPDYLKTKKLKIVATYRYILSIVY